MAMASASAASGYFGSAFGSKIFSITRIWCLSAWPAPTTVFLTWFGAYSATEMPNIAGASIATPRAWPSFRVATPSLLTKVCSTAASAGLKSPSTEGRPFGRSPRAATDERQPVAVDLDHAPAGAAQARIDAKDAQGMANRLRCHGLVITPAADPRNIYPSSYPAKAGYPVRRGLSIRSQPLWNTGSPGQAGRRQLTTTNDG